jgi:hypothetical protein
MKTIRSLAILATLGAALLATVPAAQAQEIEFGTVRFTNDYSGSVTVRLYHADALDRVFATWYFASEETARLTLNDEAFTIGGDWIVEIRFGNGVTSQRRLVYKVGSHTRSVWNIRATDVYRGR